MRMMRWICEVPVKSKLARLHLWTIRGIEVEHEFRWNYSDAMDNEHEVVVKEEIRKLYLKCLLFIVM